jgi:hypothetical protein
VWHERMAYACNACVWPAGPVWVAGTRDGSGSGLGRPVGFGSCGFRFVDGFYPRFSVSGLVSGSVSGLVFHPWISNGYPK